MFGIGAGEFILILIVGLIVFGPSKLPEFGRSLGKLIRELKKMQATLSNAINLEDPPSSNVSHTPSNTESVSSNPATTTATDSKVNETSSTNNVSVSTTEQLTQLANSNPIRLDKVNNSDPISSKEQLTK